MRDNLRTNKNYSSQTQGHISSGHQCLLSVTLFITKEESWNILLVAKKVQMAENFQGFTIYILYGQHIYRIPSSSLTQRTMKKRKHRNPMEMDIKYAAGSRKYFWKCSISASYILASFINACKFFKIKHNLFNVICNRN